MYTNLALYLTRKTNMVHTSIDSCKTPLHSAPLIGVVFITLSLAPSHALALDNEGPFNNLALASSEIVSDNDGHITSEALTEDPFALPTIASVPTIDTADTTTPFDLPQPEELATLESHLKDEPAIENSGASSQEKAQEAVQFRTEEQDRQQDEALYNSALDAQEAFEAARSASAGAGQ